MAAFKTAEELNSQIRKCILPSEQINLIRIYGIECAKKALDEAGKDLKEEYKYFDSNLSEKLSKSILDTNLSFIK